MDRVGSLFDAYIENDLSPDEREELCAALRQSDVLVEDFVRESYLHAQLAALLREQSLRDSVMALPACQIDGPWPTPGGRRARPAANARGASRRISRVVAALAVCL